ASVERIELGPAREAEDLVVAWRNALGCPVSARGVQADTATGSAEQALQLGLHLRERILDPVLSRMGSARVVHVIQDDFLQLVPLDALPLDRGVVGERYVVQEEVSFARLIHPPRVPEAAPKLVLAGGIDYEAELVAVPSTPDAELSQERSGAGSAGF